MDTNLKSAKDDMLSWWFIFSQTGDVEDGRMLLDSIKQYDLLLEYEDTLEI